MDDKVKTDRSDDWEVVSKSEADSVPYISFPKMHEFIEEIDSISYGTSTESNRKNEEGLLMERKDEDIQEQLSQPKKYEKSEKLRRDIDEVMKDKSFHCRQEQENKNVAKEIGEAMQGASQNEQENDKLRREILEALQDVSLNEQENDRVRREMLQALQDVSLIEQENDRVRREILDALQDVSHNEQENKLRREMLEAVQDVSQNEQENNTVRREIEEALQDISQIDQENCRVRREMLEALQDVSRNDQEKDRVRREMEEARQDNTSTSIAARCSKPQIRAVEGESFATAKENKNPVLHSEFNEAFQQYFKVNAVVQDKVSAEVAKVDELEKDLWVKISSEDLESFRNEGIDNSPSDEENKGMD